MADQTRGGISYCDRTWNVTLGCSPVSAGCAACWASRMVRRIESAQHSDSDNPTVTAAGQWNGEICLRPAWLAKPLHWRYQLTILVQTLGDLFHAQVPVEYIAAVCGAMAACPEHTFLLLTKRPERMLEFHQWLEERGGLEKYLRSETGRNASRGLFASGSVFESYRGRKVRGSGDAWARVLNAAAVGPCGNIWSGISAENQAELDRRVPLLLQVPAAHRWLSLEPLLGPVAIRDAALAALDFVAVGPETGPRARPCDVEWIRSVVRQCRDAGLPVHVKAVPVHVGKPSKNPREWPEDLRVQDEVPHG